MHGQQDMEELYRKFIDRNITESELRRLFVHFGTEDETVLRGLIQAASLHLNDPTEDEARQYDAYLAPFEQRLHDRIQGKGKAHWFASRTLRYAAILLVGVSIGIGLYLRNRSEAPTPALTSKYGDDALPGGNRATLTLADGRTIDLSAEQSGIVVADGITYLDGTEVIENGQLKIENERDSEEKGSLNTNYYVLSTPKGGTYQITLPDGSKVWLNANSTLRYPSRFSGDVREIMLEGEAYFSVTSIISHLEGNRGVKGTPFKVKTAGQTVEVFGTEFNISAYPDDPETKTTLVEGSVRVAHATNGASLQLVPGEQGITFGGSMDKRPVDTEQFTSWKDGYFKFDGNLRDIMAQIARWYDVSVEYRGIGESTELLGDISRDRTLADVLQALEATGKVTFKIESNDQGRRVIVMP